MPYKDPEEQKKYQINWVTAARRDWLVKQKCEMCGRRMNLRVFREAGTPRLSWSLKGPSHDKFRVVCGDTAACLQRQGALEKEEEEQKPAPQSGPSKLAKQLEKKDIRPVCPLHGPNNTTVLHRDKRRRFICCGRMVE